MFRRRYFRILWFFGWTILSFIGWDIILPRIGLRAVSNSTRSRRLKMIARRFRNLAVQMGGVLIKVGQFLSARLDVLPREITSELSGLQDEVAPAPFEPIQEMLEAEFGMPIEQKFSHFEHTPLAAASIGQAYCAKLPGTREDGTPWPSVVVKVQRPLIDEIIETDLSALRIVGRWVERYQPISKRANVPKLLEEFSRSLYEEIDYMHEGKNAETFAANFKDDPKVRVPRVIWSHTTKRVLTLEDVGGIKITDYAAIEDAGIDRGEVATRLFDTYLKQIFEDGFFHADPHPGNLFVQVADQGADAKEWKLVFVDFGMTGTLPEETFKGLRELLISIGTQDAHRLIQAYEMLNLLLPGADTELLERASREVFHHLWGKSTSQLRQMGHREAEELADEFGDLLYEMPFQVPENFILLGRCISILSGMCSGLNPDFNVWVSISPYASSMVEKEGTNRWETVLEEAGKIFQVLIALPGKTDSLIDRMSEGKLEVRTPSLTREVQRLERSQRKTAGAVVFAALLLAAVQLYLAGQIIPAAAFAGVALIAFFWILFGR